MGHDVTIGGERLGAGKKMKAHLHNYERSTHDMGYVWRSTMSAGTLVPFLTEVALPGDTFDIDLNCEILTMPTIGPLFGTYKIQLDVFQVPIRLYNAKLHMNMLNIGMDMSKVHLPQLFINAPGIVTSEIIDNQQINPSHLLSYLNIRGVGYELEDSVSEIARFFNAVPYLAYWDIYKNYYANKQEEVGAYVHRNILAPLLIAQTATLIDAIPEGGPIGTAATPQAPLSATTDYPTKLAIAPTDPPDAESFDPNTCYITVTYDEGVEVQELAVDLFNNWIIDPLSGTPILGTNPTDRCMNVRTWVNVDFSTEAIQNPDAEPKVTTFPLTNIDDMRFEILQFDPTLDTPFVIDKDSPAPYGPPIGYDSAEQLYATLNNQEGLALKTYNSDLFNNWISTEWIDGVDGISAITAIDTSGGSFTIDELNLSKKIYDMLNRIAISGGTYDDWLDAVYTHKRDRSAENPMYIGGLMRNLVFQEVVSNSETPTQPLGTLAGRGVMGNKNKGGKIIAKIDEPSYIMGIISLTPNVDYSQGNKWDTNLKTLNDLHKPALDEIGFQDLITDQMAWFDTPVDDITGPAFKSAGKQPAWINYMTNVNQVRGNFADQTQQMFMTLNRRYEVKVDAAQNTSIQDLTTYIDPSKFNHIFADTRRDAQNFWAQVGIKMEVRRKMSAKIMPNL